MTMICDGFASSRRQPVQITVAIDYKLWYYIYLPTNAATYCRPTGLLKNPPSIATSRGDDDGCCGCGCGARRHVRAGGDGAAPSASAAAASHVRDDANAYGFGRNGSPNDGRRNSLCDGRRETGKSRRRHDGSADGRTDERTSDTAWRRTEKRLSPDAPVSRVYRRPTELER